MNRDNFLRLADAIEKENRFNLATFGEIGDDGGDPTADDILHNCGAVACVAGWAWAIMRVDDERPDAYMGASTDVTGEARMWLGITAHQADRLFFGDYGSLWGEVADELGLEYFADEDDDDEITRALADWSSVTPQMAADVLRRIANGELEL